MTTTGATSRMVRPTEQEATACSTTSVAIPWLLQWPLARSPGCSSGTAVAGLAGTGRRTTAGVGCMVHNGAAITTATNGRSSTPTEVTGITTTVAAYAAV